MKISKALTLPCTFAAALILTLGCGTIVNRGATTLTPPPGGTIDGVAGPVPARKNQPHTVVYPDGHQCIVGSSFGVGYVVADILLFPVGVIVDAVTGDWKKLDVGSCPGVTGA
jgi:hypothetical protein